MSDGKIYFYIVIVSVLCLTFLVGSCTVSNHLCRTEAIKAGKTADEIRSICKP